MGVDKWKTSFKDSIKLEPLNSMEQKGSNKDRKVIFSSFEESQPTTDSSALLDEGERQRWVGIALKLAYFTILYNLAEGLVSIAFGASDDSV